MGEKIKRKAPAPICKCLRDWNISAISLRVGYIFLVMLSIISSVIVASKFSSMEPIWVEILAMIAAISVGLLSALDIGGNANRMRKAWRKLNAAVIKYEEEENYKLEELLSTYEAAEAMIADSKESAK